MVMPMVSMVMFLRLPRTVGGGSGSLGRTLCADSLLSSILSPALLLILLIGHGGEPLPIIYSSSILTNGTD